MQMDKPMWLDNVQIGEAISLVPGVYAEQIILKCLQQTSKYHYTKCCIQYLE
jgi:hypothetical protein